MARRPAPPELATLGALAQHPSLEQALDAARELLGMDIAYATHFDDGAQVFEHLRGDAASFGVYAGLRMPLEQTFCRHILDGRMAHLVPDMREDPVGGEMPITAAARVGAYASVPVLLSDGSVYGTLCCASHDARALDERDEQFMLALARMVAGEIEREQLRERRHRSQLQAAASMALMAAMEARDRYTSEHSTAVVRLVGVVARRLGVGDAQVAEVEQVALLHDIGKIAIPDAVLHHPGPLEPDAWEVMRTHPSASEQIVASVPGLAHLAPAVRAEHERWDGCGYPDGLPGEAIPLASRIVLACDAYHAMTSDRPYRPRLTDPEAREELRRGSGSQFDPNVVDVLLDALDR